MAKRVAFPPYWGLSRLFIAGMLCLHVLVFVELRERIWHGYPDFTIFYTAAKMLRQGLGPHLYDPRTQRQVQDEFAGSIDSRHGPLPYNHPPFEAVVFVPLTWLPYREAFVVWDLLNGVALFGVALLLRRHLNGLRFIRPWEFGVGFLAFFPVFLCLLQGQDSILLLLVCTLAYRALEKEADVLAGCWLALGTFKFQLVLPLVLLLILWRRKKVAVGFVSVALALAAISFLLVGWNGVLLYPRYVLQLAQSAGLDVPPELVPNLRGLIVGWPWKLMPGLLTAVVAAGSGFLIFLAAQKGRTASREEFDLQFSLAVIVAELVGWHTNAHDLSVLILPLMLMANYCFSTLKDIPGRKLALLLPVLLLVISPLWIGLWLGIAKLNLMAIPILWWSWEIGREVTRSAYLSPELRA